jgi:CheY-like chemotaxis protein/HPt (histidine-containing phosphotransfer) domain-containing protein
VLALLATEAGFLVQSFASGEAALESLQNPSQPQLDIALIDMQMPGISGDSLARLLRLACGPHTSLLAMSASAVPPERRTCFDGFLLKPFTFEQVESASVASHADAAVPPSDEVLNSAIYDALAQSMPVEQLRRLYLMCLDDAEARIGPMRAASAANDPEAYRRGAHSIKGGCGMVGATQLANLAAQMEDDGPTGVGDEATFSQFLQASARLRRILDAP